MKFVYNDGGRQKAGYKGATGDCAVRSISIATGRDYKEVYDSINALGKQERTGKRKRGKSNARTGVYKQAVRKYMQSIGWRFVPTMFIGSGCRVHLTEKEIPTGRLVVCVSKHFVAVINNVMYDTHNPDREGKRCVYGYYKE